MSQIACTRPMIPHRAFYDAVHVMEMTHRAWDVCVGEGPPVEYGDMVAVFDVMKIGNKDGPLVTTYSMRSGHNPLVFMLGSDTHFIGLHAVVHGMREDGKRIATIPAALAFGELGTVDENGRVKVPPHKAIYVALHMIALAPPLARWN